MIRVLVADDSHSIRIFLSALLEGDPEVQVVGEAVNGVQAVEAARRLRPDVITMDIHMPVMDGLHATAQIMHEIATPIVVVSSSVSAQDVATSMDALKAGALVALPKPGGGSDRNSEDDRQNFVATVKAMSKVKVVRRWSGAFDSISELRGGPPAGKSSAASASPPHRANAWGTISTPDLKGAGPSLQRRVSLVAIAASTGGPTALQRVLSSLPASFPAPIVLVQHIARGFLPGFASWLNSECALKVKVAEASELLEPGVVYVAPDDAHLGVLSNRKTTRLHGAAVNGFCPSASVLFDSAADAYGSALVAVILTGMGSDGVSGLRRVKAKGGYVIAQDEASSLIYGMPGEAVSAGVTDISLSVEVIGTHLSKLAER